MDPATIAALDSLLRLGVAGVLAMGFILVLRGALRVGTLVDRREEQYQRQIADLVVERNEWRTIAETSVAKIGRLTDVLEATLGKKLVE